MTPATSEPTLQRWRRVNTAEVLPLPSLELAPSFFSTGGGAKSTQLGTKGLSWVPGPTFIKFVTLGKLHNYWTSVSISIQ